MRYIVKSVVCDYGVFEKTDNGEKLIEICNSKSNAELIADILNTDLKNERYEVVKKSKIDKTLKEMDDLASHKVRPISFDQAVAVDMCIGILKRNVGE